VTELIVHVVIAPTWLGELGTLELLLHGG